MQSPRVYCNNIGSICTDSLRHGNGLSALLLLTRAAKSSAAKSSASKTRSMESRLYSHEIALPREATIHATVIATGIYQLATEH